MIYCNNTEKAKIFSKQQWETTGRGSKIRILKTFEKEIIQDLALKSKPKVHIVKGILAAGKYDPYENSLYVSEEMALQGIQLFSGGAGTPRQDSNIYILFAICHELEHAAQDQRVNEKIEWNPEDDRNGIITNLQQEGKGQLLPYIKGWTKAAYSYEFYQLQPAEYGANQKALQETLILLNRYKDYCTISDLEETKRAIQVIESESNPSLKMGKIYHTDNIVRDISFCLQNLFLGKQYPVPPDLMLDIEDACHKSYELVHSPRYQQLELRLKREINRQLAAQEYER